MNSNPFADLTSGLSTPTIIEPDDAEVGSSSFSNRADAGSPLPTIESHSPEPPETGDTSINTSYTDTISNTSIQQPLDFTVLFEPELSDTLTKLANATTFESSDSVSFQPCRQAGVNQDRTVLEKWNYAQQYVGSESWRFAGIFDGSCIINVMFGCE